MWVWNVVMERTQQLPGAGPRGGGRARGVAWEGDVPSMISPSSALSPWIGLHDTLTSAGLTSNPVLSHQFKSAIDQVRAVGTVEKIDSYFQKYQMGHTKASPVMPHHTPPPGSTIPILRTDPQDSGIEDLMDLTPSRHPRPAFQKSVLTDKELMVYKHSLLCAQFPVLGSKLPSPLLTSPTAPAHTPRGGGANLLTTPPPSPGAGSLEGGVGDEDDAMVQEATLCVLVREAFGLSEERHLFYDEYITKGLGNKPPAKLLVEELMGRLSLLQTNSHPYYTPQAFETRNAYDLWQQQEGQRISALINRFWRGPLPNLDPLVCRASYWTSMHTMYQDLMALLLKHDKILKAGTETGCPLLSGSRRLLREFSLHYGVGEVFRRVVYLDFLSSKELFEGEDWFLKHLSQTMAGITDLLVKHQARVIMVRNEFDMLIQALVQIKERCCDQLERLLQERSPQSKVVCLVTVLTDILELDAMLFGRLEGNLQSTITQSLKESIQNSYNGHKLRLTTELRLNAYTRPVSAELISKLIVHIQSEIQHCQENYQQLFKLYHVEVMESAASTFYSCLMADVSVLCDRTSPSQERAQREYVDPDMVAMARRLDRLDQDWKQYIPAPCQEWRRCLTKSAVHWFQYLIRDAQAMLVYSTTGDKFEAVHLNFSPDGNGFRSNLTGHHSLSNAAALTQSIGSAFASVVPREAGGQKPEDMSNNNVAEPTRTDSRSSEHSGISFNPQGVLNFTHPFRTQSFPQINELLNRTEQWSAAGDKERQRQRTASNAPRTPSGTSPSPGSSAFRPVQAKSRAATVSLDSRKKELPHSQSYPQLSAAVAATSSTMPATPLKHPADAFHDDYTSGKDQSTESTGRSRSDSSRPSSERTITPDIEHNFELSLGSQAVLRRRHRETLRAVFEQLGLFSGEGVQHADVTLPISSSLVDMVYVVRHICGLMQDICSVLKPEMVSEPGEVMGQEALGQMAVNLQQLMISPLQAVTVIVRLFGSNMLTIDLCATPVRAVNQIISKEVFNRVLIDQNAGLLSSCRHKRSGILDCNMYSYRDSDCLADNFEPINPQMCLRINNIQGLIELLPDLIPGSNGDLDPRSPRSHDSKESRDDRRYRPLQKYLQELMACQVRLLAFKVNLMLSQALKVLLELDLGSQSIAERLHPLTSCIHNHLVATATWLYPQCFQAFCIHLWKLIVKDFEKLVEELLLQRTDNQMRARLLLQAVAHVMETMNNHEEHGLNADVFLEPADGMIQILQLYTWPTSRLVQLYRGLLQKAWDGTSTEALPVKRETLRMMQRLLCQQKKCFTGNELLRSLVQCHEGVNKPDNMRDWAFNIAEKLLKCGLVRRMMASGHTMDFSTLKAQDMAHQGEVSDSDGYNFPEVTLLRIPQTSKKMSSRDAVKTDDTDSASDVSRRLGGGRGVRRRRMTHPDTSDDDDEEEEEDVAWQPVVVEAQVHEHREASSPEHRELSCPVVREANEGRTTPIGLEHRPQDAHTMTEADGSNIVEETSNQERQSFDEAIKEQPGNTDDEIPKDHPFTCDPRSDQNSSTLCTASKGEVSKRHIVTGGGDGGGVLVVDQVEVSDSSRTAEGDLSKDRLRTGEDGRRKESLDGLVIKLDYESGDSLNQETKEQNSPAEGVADGSNLIDSHDALTSEKQTENIENDQTSSSNQSESDKSYLSEYPTANSGMDSESNSLVPGEGHFQTIEQSVRPQRTDSLESRGEPSAIFVPIQDPALATVSRQRAESGEQSDHLPALVSDFTATDTSDFEDLLTPRTLSPAPGPWSLGGATVFTPDSTHLYCFSHVYDPITEEEGEVNNKGKSSRMFQRMVDNLDASCSPELVIAIISSRRDGAARQFINQLGDVSLLTGEASFIKRLCKACFTL